MLNGALIVGKVKCCALNGGKCCAMNMVTCCALDGGGEVLCYEYSVVKCCGVP